MEALRSCYRSSFRLFPDRPDVLTPGEWKFCLPGAAEIPFFHPYGSRTWDEDGSDYRSVTLGEVLPRGSWRRGDTPEGMNGTHYCGTQEVWQNGVFYGNRINPEDEFEGEHTEAFCCSAEYDGEFDESFDSLFRPE